MEILEQLFTAPMAVFIIAIGILVELQRRIIEFISGKYWKDISESKAWRNLFLPFGPVGTGIWLAIAFKDYPFPEVLAGTWGGRAALGLGCGAFAGTIYQSAKQYILIKFKKVTGTDVVVKTETKVKTVTETTTADDQLNQ